MKVALLTSGGIAPCLSASIGRLASQYYNQYSDVQIIGYLHGYKGLLLGKSINIEKSSDFAWEVCTLTKKLAILHGSGEATMSGDRKCCIFFRPRFPENESVA